MCKSPTEVTGNWISTTASILSNLLDIATKTILTTHSINRLAKKYWKFIELKTTQLPTKQLLLGLLPLQEAQVFDSLGADHQSQCQGC